MSFFISLRTFAPKGNHSRGGGWSQKFRKRQFAITKNHYCHYCKRKLTYDTSTTEHIIPAVVKQLSFGKLINPDCKCVLSCAKCNSDNNKISSYIGDVIHGDNIKMVQKAATKLCDLVRSKGINHAL